MLLLGVFSFLAYSNVTLTCYNIVIFHTTSASGPFGRIAKTSNSPLKFPYNILISKSPLSKMKDHRGTVTVIEKYSRELKSFSNSIITV